MQNECNVEGKINVRFTRTNRDYMENISRTVINQRNVQITRLCMQDKGNVEGKCKAGYTFSKFVMQRVIKY